MIPFVPLFPHNQLISFPFLLLFPTFRTPVNNKPQHLLGSPVKIPILARKIQFWYILDHNFTWDGFFLEQEEGEFKNKEAFVSAQMLFWM